MALHTSPNCAISSSSGALFNPTSQNCDANVDGNVGCSFKHNDNRSYGSGFNAAGGGVYAMEWNSAGISIWFWPRGAAPGDVLADRPNPGNWGAPAARWAGTGCDWDGKFREHNLIFDTTFCGDWAGAVYGDCAGTGQTCQAFVQNNPGAFRDAFWKVNALKVYQDNGASLRGNLTATLAGRTTVHADIAAGQRSHARHLLSHAHMKH